MIQSVLLVQSIKKTWCLFQYLSKMEENFQESNVDWTAAEVQVRSH